MSIQYISSDLIATSDAITGSTSPIAITNNNLLVLSDGADIVSTTSSGITATTSVPTFTYDFVFLGDMFAADHAVRLTTFSGALTTFDVGMVIGEGSTITSQNEHTIEIGSSVGRKSGAIDIDNAGHLTSPENVALYLNDVASINVQNTGTISSNDIDTVEDNAIYLLDFARGVVNNSGIIQNRSVTDFPLGAIIDDVAAISFVGAADSVAQLTNSGSLTGGSHALYMKAKTAKVDNSGTINGDVFFDLGSTETSHFKNTGTVNGTMSLGAGVDVLKNAGGLIDGDLMFMTSDDRLLNTGTILGDVDMGFQNDFVRNTGFIDGNLDLSNGNDTLRGFDGDITGTISGGSGDDHFYINQADAVIDGGSDTDTIRARSDVLNATNVENIILLGSADLAATGDDATTNITGNNGNNVLISGAANAMMMGHAGNDLIDGGQGNDTLNGGFGDDTLIGGLGTDEMAGDYGSDVFVFNEVSEMGRGATRDVLTDFQRGMDLIDVSAISSGAFSFVGLSGFTSSGTMEISFRLLAGGTTALVEFDENGSGNANGQLLLRGVTDLDAADFIL